MSNAICQKTQTEQKQRTLYTGIINIVSDSFDFPLLGFVNIGMGSHKTAQIGFVNVNQKTLHGTQIGYINYTQTLRGFQLGLINVVDSIDKGVALGIISFVRQRGYQALEVSFSEMYPVNLAFKMGTKKLYNTFSIAYNPRVGDELAYGLGLGSILPINKLLFVNPEATWMTAFAHNPLQSMSVRPQLGLDLGAGFKVLAGPSIIWNHISKNGIDKLASNPEWFSLYKHTLDERNNVMMGFRVGLCIELNY